MRILVIFCHPYEKSFSASLFECAKSALADAGHEVRSIDLYRDGFDPVLSRDEWLSYMDETDKNIARLKEHVDALLWAEGLVFVYPTWMYGPPSMLKGWMERVWLPGVAFEVPPGEGQRLVGRLRNIRQFVVITTSGSPHWWLLLIRNPGRRMMVNGHKMLFNKRCRTRWLQLYDMDHTTPEKRSNFLKRVEKTLKQL